MIEDFDMEILMELSDNKGYSNRELVELLGKHKANLSTRLNKLAREFVIQDFDEENGIHFSVDDLKDPIGLAARLKERKELLSKFIIGQFDNESKKILNDSTDYDRVARILLSKLNEIIDGASILKEQYISDTNLSERTKALAKRSKLNPPIGIDDIRYLNRFLLEDAYSTELYSSNKSIRLNHIIYYLPEKTRRENAPHPNQLEQPYYINEDLDIFKIILEYFEYKSREVDGAIVQLLEKNGKKGKEAKII